MPNLGWKLKYFKIQLKNKASKIHKNVANKIRSSSNKTKGFFKGTLSGLRQFLAAETPLKVMKNALYFTSKALSILKIFNFLSSLLAL